MSVAAFHPSPLLHRQRHSAQIEAEDEPALLSPVSVSTAPFWLASTTACAPGQPYPVVRRGRSATEDSLMPQDVLRHPRAFSLQAAMAGH